MFSVSELLAEPDLARWWLVWAGYEDEPEVAVEGAGSAGIILSTSRPAELQ